MKTILITGATRGLGLAFAQQLAEEDGIKVVLGVRDLTLGQEIAASLGRNVEAAFLDLASRSSIEEFIAQWNIPLFALINNAGLQFTGPVVFSPDGVEMTLAVNHLGPLQLTLGLLPWLEGGAVLGVGSGTHNPNDRVAKMFGFRGGRFSSVASLAKGDMDAPTERQAGMDRYATSKLLSMTTTAELARRYPNTTFATLDPGLMPGTGLVRTAPAFVRWAWRRVLPALAPLISGASTPAKSAAAGCLVMFSGKMISGQVYDYTSRRSEEVWDLVFDADFGANVVHQSIAALTADDQSRLI